MIKTSDICILNFVLTRHLASDTHVSKRCGLHHLVASITHYGHTHIDFLTQIMNSQSKDSVWLLFQNIISLQHLID